MLVSTLCLLHHEGNSYYDKKGGGKIMTSSLITLSEEGVVIEPEWSLDSMAVVVQEMHQASPSPGMQDILVLARIFYELFEENLETRFWPVLSRHEHDRSLTQAMIEPSCVEDRPALERAEAEEIIAAANIARWALRLPQQPDPWLVFVPELPAESLVVSVPAQDRGFVMLREAPVG